MESGRRNSGWAYSRDRSYERCPHVHRISIGFWFISNKGAVNRDCQQWSTCDFGLVDCARGWQMDNLQCQLRGVRAEITESDDYVSHFVRDRDSVSGEGPTA